MNSTGGIVTLEITLISYSLTLRYGSTYCYCITLFFAFDDISYTGDWESCRWHILERNRHCGNIFDDCVIVCDTGFTLSHSKDQMCCDAFNRTPESRGFSREYDKKTNVPR